ncbi:MAG: NAD-dependent epimerase/dehydratase family protein [Syntrophobacteraceae bacterium]
MARILISGGAGFIGFHLADQLSRSIANEILLLDNFSRGRLDNDLSLLLQRPNITLRSVDLTNPETYQSLETDFDEIYHLGAVIGVKNVLDNPPEVVRVNATATLHMLDWFCKCGHGKLLFSSTSETYAWTQHILELPFPTPEKIPLALTDLEDPRSSYAGSKIFGELAVTQYCRFFNRPFVIVRYHNVYGPRMGREHVIPQLFQRGALEGQDPLLVYSADHTRAFCYVSDAVDATISAMRTHGADDKTINIGNNREEVSIRELARRILEAFRPGARIESKPACNDPVKRRCPDLRTAEELLNYRPKVCLQDGLKLTLAWYEANPRK